MQGDKPIWVEAHLRYVKRQIGEGNEADRSVSTFESRCRWIAARARDLALALDVVSSQQRSGDKGW